MSYNFDQSSTSDSSILYKYGKAMFQYAIAQWVSFGLGLLALFVYMGQFVSLMQGFADNTLIDPTDVMGLGAGGVILSIISFGAGVYSLVTFILYLINLKRASDATGDANLRAHFVNEIRIIVSGVILMILTIIAIVSLFSIIFSQIDMIDPYNSTPDSVMFSLLSKIFLWLAVILLGAIAVLVFQVLSVIKLDAWGESLVAQYGGQMQAIKEGTNLVKWGQIMAFIPIASYFSGIVMALGYTKAGKVIQDTYAGDWEGGMQFSTTAGQTQFPSYKTPSQPGLGGDQTLRPSGGSMTICPHCGAPLPDSGATFCAMCGRKLQ